MHFRDAELNRIAQPGPGEKRSRCALESAAARRNRAGGLGRYLTVPSASCGHGRRAQIAIKTCRLELTETRIWVSYGNLISRSSDLFIYFSVLICVWVVSHASAWLLSGNLWFWTLKKHWFFFPPQIAPLCTCVLQVIWWGWGLWIPHCSLLLADLHSPQTAFFFPKAFRSEITIQKREREFLICH